MLETQLQQYEEQLSKQIHILLVEDNPADARYIKELIRECTHSDSLIEHASSLSSALDYLDKMTVDVVFLDLNLPDTHNFEALETLSVHTTVIPLIVLSGDTRQNIDLKAISKGADEFIPKNSITTELIQRSLLFSMERKSIQSRLFEFNKDILTNLPNRKQLRDHVSRLINRFERSQIDISVMFIDLDDFKSVNDTFGHDVGDKLLIELSNKLTSTIRKSDFLARIGGDEFIMVVEHEKGKSSDLVYIANNLIGLIEEPVKVANIDVELNISCSIGISTTHMFTEQLTVENLLNHADEAMYVAKKEGGGQYHIYDENLDTQFRKKTQVIKGFTRAIENNEFTIYYQPIVSFKNKSISGVEALIRWFPKNGEEEIKPGDFIPLLEESNRIFQVGEWIIRNAISGFRQLLDSKAIDESGFLNINISAKQLTRSSIIDTLNSSCEEFNVHPNSINLEITEHFMIKNPTLIINQMNLICESGYNFSLDDFGTGYSSMTHLKDLPLKQIKIDKSFIQSVFDSRQHKLITSVMINLGKNLMMDVIAEGIEDENISKYLAKQGCNTQQGFLFYKPMPVDKLIKVITQPN